MTIDEHGRTAPRSALAVGLAGLVAVELGTAVVGVLLAGFSAAQVRDSFVATNAAIALSCAVAGLLVASQRPRNAVGWLLLTAGALQGLTAATAPLVGAGPERGWPEPVVRLLATLAAYAWPWSIGLCLPLALLLFPDGRLLGRRWRPAAGLVVASGALFTVSLGADPGGLLGDGSTAGWLVIPDYAELTWLWSVGEALNSAAYLAAVVALVLRYRRGDERLRRQLLWLVLALVLMVVAVAVWVWLPTSGPQVLILLVVPLVPAAITVAVLRHQLLDIRLVLARAVLYALLTAGVGTAYLAVVAAADGVLNRAAGAPVLAALVVALAFHPVRVRLQRWVDRAVYGDRDPFRTMSRLGERLGGAAGQDTVLDAVREALKLPYAALRVDGSVRGASGTEPERCETVELAYGGVPVGELVVGVRRGQGRLGSADRAALELVAVPLAAAVHASALSAAVQRSRGEIVAAREEERRRLRRDLHDGLGPVLTGVAFTADAARNLLRGDPDRADALLGDLRDRAGEAIADIRRLVHDLRPPSLDELGLVEALRRHTEQFADSGLTVRVDAPVDLPALPAGVEVAAYRIVVEALTNVVRHAGASRVDVRLACDGGLEVDVLDDGGGQVPWRAGVGLRSIGERAAELGGHSEVGPVAGGGRVRAVLPWEPS